MKKSRKRRKGAVVMNSQSTDNSIVEGLYKTPQAKGKALKRVIAKLPKSPRRQKRNHTHASNIQRTTDTKKFSISTS